MIGSVQRERKDPSRNPVREFYFLFVDPNVNAREGFAG
jgi:hypothetical protein